MGEVETRLCTTNRHQPILRSLVNLGICRVPASVIAPDIVNSPRFGLHPMIAQLQTGLWVFKALQAAPGFDSPSDR